MSSLQQGLELEPDVIRLPAEVLEPACFEISGAEPVTFDLTATCFLASPALLGLRRTAEAMPVHLVVPPGPVLDKLIRRFSVALRRVGLCSWELSL